jgi:hypothetical protein
MHKSRQFLLHFVLLALSLAITNPSRAQSTDATLSGTVTNASAAAIPGAKISVKNLNTGQSTDSQTDAAGSFTLPKLTPGDYEVSVTAVGLAPQVVKVTLAAGAAQTLTLALTAHSGPAADSRRQLAQRPLLQQDRALALRSGFTPEQAQGNAREQALLDKRTHMLKIHQKLGLITTAPLIATVVTSIGGGRHTSNTDRTVHMVLGSVTGDLYFTSAYFAIRAPRAPGATTTRGPIRFHKAMAWIYGPGMIVTPILGALAYQQKNNGEHVHGLAAAHGPVAVVTAGAFGAALLSVSMKF